MTEQKKKEKVQFCFSPRASSSRASKNQIVLCLPSPNGVSFNGNTIVGFKLQPAKTDVSPRFSPLKGVSTLASELRLREARTARSDGCLRRL